MYEWSMQLWVQFLVSDHLLHVFPFSFLPIFSIY